MYLQPSASVPTNPDFVGWLGTPHFHSSATHPWQRELLQALMTGSGFLSSAIKCKDPWSTQLPDPCHFLGVLTIKQQLLLTQETKEAATVQPLISGTVMHAVFGCVALNLLSGYPRQSNTRRCYRKHLTHHLSTSLLNYVAMGATTDTDNVGTLGLFSAQAA